MMLHMKKFNNWLANLLGNGLSNMYFFYFCIILDAIELSPVLKSHSTVLLVSYLSQSVIQLLALPVLGAQNKLQNENHKEIVSHVKAIHARLGINSPYRRK